MGLTQALYLGRHLCSVRNNAHLIFSHQCKYSQAGGNSANRVGCVCGGGGPVLIWGFYASIHLPITEQQCSLMSLWDGEQKVQK